MDGECIGIEQVADARLIQGLADRWPRYAVAIFFVTPQFMLRAEWTTPRDTSSASRGRTCIDPTVPAAALLREGGRAGAIITADLPPHLPTVVRAWRCLPLVSTTTRRHSPFARRWLLTLSGCNRPWPT
ncbi:hypothetical protein ACCAA_1060006 [Candidatus Accumulibacter aalborgensis]|uniref:Uncharacterized protein n=1 Tax=Candidatus Accumulibacter aalborgensis TaxID=1860102 RepID=A0A1A8XEC2_9PROT|nr:hypothetical protein ACCAA_1060006 [Candidatus Accumulibacter aalborgensis]